VDRRSGCLCANFAEKFSAIPFFVLVFALMTAFGEWQEII
jgi:hypothetical protein